MPTPLPLPVPRLSLGVTGHRNGNAAFAANREGVSAALEAIFARIDAMVAAEPGAVATTRLHALLANGVDQIAARAALARGWELIAPLPYARLLNRAINAAPQTAADARALLSDRAPDDGEVAARAAAIAELEGRAHLFEIVDRDEAVAELFTATLEAPGDLQTAQAFAAHNADHVALAGRVMIEQSDLVVAVWDGKADNLKGGTGHTVAEAVALGTPVLLIDPARPAHWSIVTTPEARAHHALAEGQQVEALEAIVRHALHPTGGAAGRDADRLTRERWAARSSPMWLGYRLIERFFGMGGGAPDAPLIQIYETPEAIGEGSAAAMLATARALPGGDAALVDRVEREVLPDFAWADGISTWLSDAYRSGMIASFALSALAVMVGLAYQPLGMDKWMFAAAELFLLVQILGFTWLGNRRRWHERWFDTRRVAEYLRHAPVLLPLGVSRPPGRWPRGSGVAWPEYHARHRLRRLGLPEIRVSRAYLRAALETVLEPHVLAQRDYHRVKAARLARIHRRLDHIAGRFFVFAVVSVSIYLGIEALAALGVVSPDLPERAAKIFTFFGVAFPTLGASLAAIRYFGDFERFAAISDVTAEKLDALAARIRLLLSGPADAVDFHAVTDLGRAIDEITVAEIESWQAVFGGKHIALPA